MSPLVSHRDYCRLKTVAVAVEYQLIKRGTHRNSFAYLYQSLLLVYQILGSLTWLTVPGRV